MFGLGHTRFRFQGVASLFGSRFQTSHAFSCDIDPGCQRWIRAVSPSCLVFRDMRDLAQMMANEIKAGCPVRVPYIDMFIAGFVCKDLSAESSKRTENALHENGQSGITWRAVKAYVVFRLPKIVRLENVKGLKQDLTTVIVAMGLVGYNCISFELDSSGFFLPQKRVRIYIVCVRHGSDALLEDIAHFIALFGTNNPVSDASSFLVPAHEDLLLQEQAQTVERFHKGELNPEKGCGCKRRKWMTDHAIAQSALSEMRPMKSLSLDPLLVECYPDLALLSAREWDMLVLTGTEMPDAVERIAKLSASLNRVDFHEGGIIPTLTARSRFFFTRRGRLLRGREALRLQGMFVPAEITNAFSDTFLLSKSGNAFSATVCMAVVLAVFCALPKHDVSFSHQHGG